MPKYGHWSIELKAQICCNRKDDKRLLNQSDESSTIRSVRLALNVRECLLRTSSCERGTQMKENVEDYPVSYLLSYLLYVFVMFVAIALVAVAAAVVLI